MGRVESAKACAGIGLLGLGGAEFRLPLLIRTFRFPVLEAAVLNQAISLVVVASALPFRAQTVPPAALAGHVGTIATLLAGSLAGAWLGAGWAARLRGPTLLRVIAAVLLLGRCGARRPRPRPRPLSPAPRSCCPG